MRKPHSRATGQGGGDAGAYEYATIYAQWGDRAKALEWLALAVRLRDPGLLVLKTDPLMDAEGRALSGDREGTEVSGMRALLMAGI